ncbi:MAG: DUF1667 domain-containing protein [Treponema sp.]|jgi:CxxC motif-containing protein|nr:DUF1667 domain-containing protein [Treponema sp.]
MMHKLTCIGCPIGCSLTIEPGPAGADGMEGLTITGNGCKRGAAYAQEEIRSPKRVVTATCALVRTNPSSAIPLRVPVRTVLPCPKERIPELLEDIYTIRLSLPVKTGDTVIAGWRGTGISVIATRSVS